MALLRRWNRRAKGFRAFTLIRCSPPCPPEAGVGQRPALRHSDLSVARVGLPAQALLVGSSICKGAVGRCQWRASAVWPHCSSSIVVAPAGWGRGGNECVREGVSWEGCSSHRHGRCMHGSTPPRQSAGTNSTASPANCNQLQGHARPTRWRERRPAAQSREAPTSRELISTAIHREARWVLRTEAIGCEARCWPAACQRSRPRPTPPPGWRPLPGSAGAGARRTETIVLTPNATDRAQLAANATR